MIGHVMEAMLETSEDEIREFARRVSMESANEVGARPEASGIPAHIAARRAAELAVHKSFGLVDTHFDKQESAVFDACDGQVGVDASGLDAEFKQPIRQGEI